MRLTPRTLCVILTSSYPYYDLYSFPRLTLGGSGGVRCRPESLPAAERGGADEAQAPDAGQHSHSGL